MKGLEETAGRTRKRRNRVDSFAWILFRRLRVRLTVPADSAGDLIGIPSQRASGVSSFQSSWLSRLGNEAQLYMREEKGNALDA